MNHVPDDALDAVEALGEGLLVGEARPVDTRLRSDLRLRIPITDDDVAAGRTTVAFHLEHTQRHEHLLAHGDFVATVVDGVETTLREWGIDPPERYAHHRDERRASETWRVYAGTARL